MRLILYISTNHFVLQCFDAVCWGTQAVKIIPKVTCVTGWNIETVLTFLICFLFISVPPDSLVATSTILGSHQVKKCGVDAHGECRSRVYNWVLGAEPQWGLWSES